MAKSNSSRSDAKLEKMTLVPNPQNQEAQSDSEEDVEIASNDPMDKDSTEEELEKLVFGDDTGFREEVKAHARNAPISDSEGFDSGSVGSAAGQEDEGDDDLEAVGDADLFFLDSGPSHPDQAGLQTASILEDEGQDDTLRATDPPAWVDSDDERITVSLADNPRLRKLRISATEDLINGKEYTKRLRRQFERLYPVPEWALPSASTTQKPAKKKRRHVSAHTAASDMDVDSTSSSDEETLSAKPLAKILQSAGDLTSQSSSKRSKLRPEVLDIQRLKDVGGVQPSSINSLHFHPTLPLLLTSGPSSLISLFHIHPSSPLPALNAHPLLTSLHIPGTPLTTTTFLPPQGDTILLSSRRRYYHTWSLPTGVVQKTSRIYGHADTQRSFESLTPSPCGRYIGLTSTDRKIGGAGVNILSARTSQWIAEARGVESKNGLASFSWWGSGDGLTLVGPTGDVVEWSVAERRAVARWHDHGGFGTTLLVTGGRLPADHATPLGPDRWVAVGSNSGVVNIYDRLAWSSATLAAAPSPKPAKTLAHLTTPITSLAFSPDGQLLVIASKWKKDALRLVHLPSCTVYRNWPTSSTPLGRVTSVAFSPAMDDEGKGRAGGRMLAVGNEAGRVRLWEIKA